jgi:probable phosphoglycerate mutase
MQIVLVRHAQPEWVRDGLNVVDPPLTDLGRRQAEQLAERLAGEEFAEVYVSPLRRARETAAPLLAALGREERVEPWLAEIREPNWHGHPAELAASAYATQASTASDRRWEGLEGGEAPSAFVERIATGCHDFLHVRGARRGPQDLPVWEIDDPGARILLVAHAGTNGVILGTLLGLAPTPWEWDRFVTAHASVSVVASLPLGDGFTFGLRTLSDIEHVPAADRTR